MILPYYHILQLTLNQALLPSQTTPSVDAWQTAASNAPTEQTQQPSTSSPAEDGASTIIPPAALSDSVQSLHPSPITPPSDESHTTSATSSSTRPLPIDVAIHATLVPSLRQQCAFVQQASLAFFLHSLRVRDHFLVLQHFFLFRAGSTMDAFTAALFHTLHRDSNQRSGQAAAVSLSTQTLQLLWSDAVQSLPPSAAPSRILPVLDSNWPPSSSCAFSRIESLNVLDSVRLRYTVPPAMSDLLRPAAVAGYGQVFTLLMRLSFAHSEVRRVYEWLRGQETQLRRKEVEQRKTPSTSTSTGSASTSYRQRGPATASDDLLLVSPSKRSRADSRLVPFSLSFHPASFHSSWCLFLLPRRQSPSD